MLLKIITNPYVKSITIISAILSIAVIIATNINPKKVDLQVILNKEECLLDEKLSNNSISILYDSLDLWKENKTIYYYKLRVINSGRKSVGKESYDSIGVFLKNNKFISLPKVYENKNQDNYKIETKGDSIVQILPAIFNPNDKFDFSFISLCEQNSKPILSTFGKIKDQKELKFISESASKSIIANQLNDSLEVHSVRLLIYTCILLSILGIINILLFLWQKIYNFYKRRERKQLVAKFKNLDNYNYTKIDDVVFSKYVEDGIEVLQYYNKKITEFDKLLFHCEKYSLTENYLNTNLPKKEYKNLSDGKREYYELLKDLKYDGYVYFENLSLVKDSRLVYLLQEFIRQSERIKKIDNTG